MTINVVPEARAAVRTRTARVLALLAALLVLGGLVVPTGQAQAATKYGTVRAATQKMVGPHLANYRQMGTHRVGTRLVLTCYAWGQKVWGWGGVSNLWYRVSDGSYVADVDIYTGSNNPITGACPRMSHNAFVSQTRGSIWENSIGTLPGECVSLVSLYLLRVHGIKTGAWGHAVAYKSGGSGGKEMAKRGFKWRTDRSFRNGDILVWQGGVGHIAVWHNGQIYDQNNNGRKKAGSATFFSKGYLGYWRK